MYFNWKKNKTYIIKKLRIYFSRKWFLLHLVSLTHTHTHTHTHTIALSFLAIGDFTQYRANLPTQSFLPLKEALLIWKVYNFQHTRESTFFRKRNPLSQNPPLVELAETRVEWMQMPLTIYTCTIIGTRKRFRIVCEDATATQSCECSSLSPWSASNGDSSKRHIFIIHV